MNKNAGKMEIRVFPSLVLQALGVASSSLLISGHVVPSLVLTGISIAAFLHFDGKERKFQELLHDKPSH